MSYIDCETSYVPNTTMKIFVNPLGRQTQYCFYPVDGYVMHVKSVDLEIYDKTGENIVGYTELFGSGMKSVPISYDFSVTKEDKYTYTDENQRTVNVPLEKIGAEELYTLPKDIVPQKQLYDGGYKDGDRAHTEDTKNE